MSLAHYATTRYNWHQVRRCTPMFLSIPLTQTFTVNRLHPELLSYIFLLGQQQQDLDLAKEAEAVAVGEEEDIDGLVVPFALTVSQVSRRWRSVAIDTANLWTKIDFAEGPPYKFSQILLERSKNAPLNISLSLSEGDNKEGIDAVMAMLVPAHSERVSVLGINAISLNQIDWILSRFLTDTDTPPPIVDLQLTEAEASGEQVKISIKPELLPQLIKLAAGIQRLALDGVQLPWGGPMFSNLTHLKIESNPGDVEGARPTEDQFIAILKSSPTLQMLRIADTGIRLDEPAQFDHYKRHTRIEMPALKVLQFDAMPWNQLVFALHIINPPNLVDLFLGEPEDREEDDGTIVDDPHEVVDEAVGSAITRFLRALTVPSSVSNGDVQSPLRALALEALSEEFFGSERLTEILSLVPQLRYLAITEIAFDDDVLNQMHGVWAPHIEASSPNRGVLCPDLRSLTLSHVHSITHEAIYNRK